MEPRLDTSKRRWQNDAEGETMVQTTPGQPSVQNHVHATEGAKRPRLAGDGSDPQPITQEPQTLVAEYATQYTTQYSVAPEATAPHLQRALDMQLSPAVARGEIRDDSSIADFSSPVKDKETRILPEPFRLDTQEFSGSGRPAHVGGWVLPDLPEIWEERTLNIDPNGDDDVVTTQVQSILRPPPAPQQSGEEDEDVLRTQLVRASQPDTAAYQNVVHSTASQPGASTPPPARSRRRPAVPIEGAAASSSLNGLEPSSVSNSIDLSDVEAALPSIMASPYSEASRGAITRLVQSSPFVPTFLKAEVVHLLQADQFKAQSQDASESETQDDGYLPTKATWVFELCKVTAGDSIIGGDDLLADTSADMDSIVLVVHKTATSNDYKLQRASREQVLLWRANVQTNAWFDGTGQPFAVTYRSPHLEASSGSSRPSVQTQDGSSQTQQLRQELDAMTKANERLTEELAVMNASNEATQEQLDLIRRLYDDATSLASQAEKEATELRQENETLRFQVANSVKVTQGLADERIARLQSSLKSVTQQRDLLVRQNELTNDTIRKNANEWEEYVARKEQEQKRRERAEAARLETHLALQATLLGNEVSRRPQDYLLAVDLAAQRKSLDGDAASAGPSRSNGAKSPVAAEASVLDEDEDELAALQREAEQHGGDDLTINTEAPRARRSRARRSVSRSQPDKVTSGSVVDIEMDELAALREEADAAGDALLAVPVDGSSRATRRSRRSASQTAAADKPADASNVTPRGGTELSLPTSPYLGTRTRRRSRPPLDPEDALAMAEALAQGQTDAQDAASHALEAEFAAYDEAREADAAGLNESFTDAI